MIGALFLAAPVLAAELNLDFTEFHENQTPPGFRSAVTGVGKPGEWKIILDDVPSLMPPLRPGETNADPIVPKRAVLAQLAKNPADEHFPLLIYEGESFADFTLTTQFKTVSGAIERMAGIAFRLQDETNYYVARASTLGNTFRFYKVVNGQRGPIVGPELPVPSGVWHDLTVECKGNHIRCLLDGKEVISVEDKTPFGPGKIGYWTKSDSVSYFNDTKITYTPLQPPAQGFLAPLLQRYPKLLALKIYILTADGSSTRIVGSKDPSEIGSAGTKTELEVIHKAITYYGKEKGIVSVIAPLRDRNGDTIAAVRIVSKSFPGQTEENAILRAQPIRKALEARIQSLGDLVQ